HFVANTSSGPFTQTGPSSYAPTDTITDITFSNALDASIITAGGNQTVTAVAYNTSTGLFYDPSTPTIFGPSAVFNGSKDVPVAITFYATDNTTSAPWTIVSGSGVG